MSEDTRSIEDRMAAFQRRRHASLDEKPGPVEALVPGPAPDFTPPSPALLANCYLALAQIVQKLQLSSVALYKLLLEKNLITDEEFAATLEKERILFDAECRKAQQRMGEPV